MGGIPGPLRTKPQRFSWEERDGGADFFAGRGERGERGAGPSEAPDERTTKLLRKKKQPARPIPLNRSGYGRFLDASDDVLLPSDTGLADLVSDRRRRASFQWRR